MKQKILIFTIVVLSFSYSFSQYEIKNENISFQWQIDSVNRKVIFKIINDSDKTVLFPVVNAEIYAMGNRLTINFSTRSQLYPINEEGNFFLEMIAINSGDSLEYINTLTTFTSSWMCMKKIFRANFVFKEMLKKRWIKKYNQKIYISYDKFKRFYKPITLEN